MASCCASVALPPLPKASSRPPGGEPGGHRPRAATQPGAVARPTARRSSSDLLGLGDRRLAHLLEDGGHICRARVQERVERLDRAVRAARGVPVGSLRHRAPPRWLPWRAPGSCRRPRAYQGDADFLRALAGVDEGQLVRRAAAHRDLDGGVRAGDAARRHGTRARSCSRDHPGAEHSGLLEEHVHELPEHVIRGHLHLLHDARVAERVTSRWSTAGQAAIAPPSPPTSAIVSSPARAR